MRTHEKDRDPLFYYEVLNVVGVGSLNRYEISISWPETGQPGPARYVLPIQF